MLVVVMSVLPTLVMRCSNYRGSPGGLVCTDGALAGRGRPGPWRRCRMCASHTDAGFGPATRRCSQGDLVPCHQRPEQAELWETPEMLVDDGSHQCAADVS